MCLIGPKSRGLVNHFPLPHSRACEFHMLHVAPRTMTADHASLEHGAEGFIQGVFIRVADVPDGAVDTGREQRLRVADR